MDKEFEQLSLDFTSKAQKLFLLTYEKFKASTKYLDRRKDENVFQQQLGKYLNTLKRQLEITAQESIYKNKTLKNIDRCSKLLTNSIDMYLNEFRQKSGSI